MGDGPSRNPSWADECEDLPSPRALGAGSPGGILESILSLSSAGYALSSDSEDCEAPSPPPAGKGKAVAGPARGGQRRHTPRHRRPVATDFMGSARGARPSALRAPRASPPRAPSPVGHPPRQRDRPDAEGFYAVRSRRFGRRQSPHSRSPPAGSRPVPRGLQGLCFNCLSNTHVKRDCRWPARCFNCWAEGHQASRCRLPSRPGLTDFRGVKRPRSSSPRGPPHPPPSRRRQEPAHSRASADTASGASDATGRSLSIPPCCAPPTPPPPPPLSPQQVMVASPPPPPAHPPQHAAMESPPPPLAQPAPATPPVYAVDAEALEAMDPQSLPMGSSLPRHAPRAPLWPGEHRSSIVVVPRSQLLQQAEDSLGLALVAVVGGNRPAVSTTMVSAYLLETFNITATDAEVRRYEPEDFVVFFRRQDDRSRVLNAPQSLAALPLIWRPWRRTSMAHAGAFRYRVLVAMRRIPLHARSVEVAQTVLGPCCCNVEVARPRDIPDDDDREFFVTAWCWHPRFIPDYQIVFIPEPALPGAVEELRSSVPGLRYVIRLRLVAFQDWNSPPPSPPPGDDSEVDDPDDDAEHQAGGHPSAGCQDAEREKRDSDVEDDGPPENSGPGQAGNTFATITVGEVPCPIISVSTAISPRQRNQETPDMWVHRPSPPRPGPVAGFISIAPCLLQDGRSTQTPPPPEVVDWWPQCVQVELAGPIKQGRLGACDIESTRRRLFVDENYQEEIQSEADAVLQPKPITTATTEPADWWTACVQAELATPPPPQERRSLNAEDVAPRMQLPHTPVGPEQALCPANTSPQAQQNTAAIASRFVAIATAPIKTPLIRSLPRRQRHRVSPSVLRRSGRLALKYASRAPNATEQATKVKDAKWSGSPRPKPPVEIVNDIRKAAGTALDSAQRAALRKLLKFDLSGIDCAFDEEV